VTAYSTRFNRQTLNPLSHRIIVVLLACAACAGVGACSSPAKPAPVDPYPTGPKITCPEAPTPITSPTGQATTVQYGTPTVTGGAPAVATSCTPPSGSQFPIGTTGVTCSVTDARQRVDSCTFNVVVNQPARVSLTRFVAFGDSITWGEDGRSSAIVSERADSAYQPAVQFPSSQTYPGVLLSLLQSRYTTQISALGVANAGLPGEKAADSSTLSRFSSVVSSRAYESVLLMEGSNDLADRDSRQIPPAIANLRSMLRDAKSRNVRPFLATVPPMVPGRPRALPWSLVPELNANIRSLAASENVTLVDVEAGFGASFDQYIGFDGLHPNEAGYAKIAELFFNAIKSTLETQPSLVAPTAVPFSPRPHR
jgi:lysophospholipase L1-like esterase